MDMTWAPDPRPDAPDFDDDASAYAHYWLSALPAAADGSPRAVGRRSTVDQTSRLRVGTEALIGRAFLG